jgi:predicted transposase YdaD
LRPAGADAEGVFGRCAAQGEGAIEKALEVVEARGRLEGKLEGRLEATLETARQIRQIAISLLPVLELSVYPLVLLSSLVLEKY